jgi:hypothetical protein
MDGCSVGGVALLHAGHKTGLICTTVYLLYHNPLFLQSSSVHGQTISVLHVFGWGSLKLPTKLIVVFEYQLIVGPVNPNYNSKSRLVLNQSFPPISSLMRVKLNRPPKPEESQKDSNFNGKTIPHLGFEPGTSGLAVGSHNHCTIWVGSV